MTYINILTISDSDVTSNFLVDCLSEISLVYNYERCYSIEDSYIKLLTYPANIIIIDDDILNPIDFCMLQALNLPDTSIIILSKDPAKAVTCYKVGVVIVDFVLKPFSPERLTLAISRALRKVLSFNKKMLKQSSVFLPIGRANKKFVLSEICFIEAYGIYVKVHTSNGKHVINETISQIEAKLGYLGFLRIHKSYVVNLSNVLEVSATHVNVSLCGLPIGKTFRGNLEMKLGIQ